MKPQKDTKNILISNAMQIASMGIMSIGVPILIGLEKYGKFGVIFALPATLSVFIQSFYLQATKRHSARITRSLSPSISVLGTIVTFGLQSVYLEPLNSAIGSALFLLMHERVKWEALSAFQSTQKFITSLKWIEVLSIGTSLAILGSCALLEIKSYFVPLAMVFVQMIVGTIFYSQNFRNDNFTIDWRAILNLRSPDLTGSFARLHEELFITLMPQVLGTLSSLSDAGAYRISSSIIKISFKLFPYRSDVLIASPQNKLPSYSKVERHFYLLNFAAVFIAAFFEASTIFTDTPTIFNDLMTPVLICGGLVALSATFGPLINTWEFPLNAVSLLFFTLTTGALIFFGLAGFYTAFILSQVSVSFIAMKCIKSKLGNTK